MPDPVTVASGLGAFEKLYQLGGVMAVILAAFLLLVAALLHVCWKIYQQMAARCILLENDRVDMAKTLVAETLTVGRDVKQAVTECVTAINQQTEVIRLRFPDPTPTRAHVTLPGRLTPKTV